MLALPRQLSLAVFRVHLENGFSVAIGVGLTGMAAASAFGFEAAVAAAAGAVCVSISDQPDPLSQKPWFIGFALASALFFTALSSAAGFHRGAFLFACGVTGLWTGLVSAYGKRAINIATTGILAFVFAMAQDFRDAGAALDHFVLFACGAILYATYALVAAFLFDDRARRLLLAEAMRALADYLRAKAALYDPDSDGPAPFRALIEAHAILADRLQAARDSLYARKSSLLQRKRIDALIALLDLFETLLSSDADLDLLRHAQHWGLDARALLRRLEDCIRRQAERIDALTLVLRNRRASVAAHHAGGAIAELVEAARAAQQADPGDERLQAFHATASKLALADQYLAALACALDRQTPPSPIAAQLDLALFRAATPHGIGVLMRQFRYRSPALRYGIRLGLAMMAGFGLTLILPAIVHGNWVLLTIALVMRANYSVTRRRRWDRVTGTLIGCTMAVLLVNTMPPSVLLVAIVLAVGTSHAYGGIAYRITAVGASVSSLLLLHFADPHPQVLWRIADTLIGAGLSWAFSFLLPHWERYDLPGTVKSLLAADAQFADAVLRRVPVYEAYRLGRKKAVDAVAALSGAIRRLADEPQVNRRALAALGELLGANYLLASDLSSMPVLLKLRAGELAPEAESQIESTRARVVALLTPGERDEAQAQPPARADRQAPDAMEVLRRRLAHIEQSAAKVARLAARPVVENI